MKLSEVTPPLGMIAGNGDFPISLLKEASALGIPVIVAAHRGESDPAVANMAAEVEWIAVGQVKRIFKFFHRNNVKQIVFLGGITKTKLLSNFRPDLCALKILTRAVAKHDDLLLSALAAEFESRGFQVLCPSDLLESCVVKTGSLTNRSLTVVEKKNADIGWGAAKELGRLDIGQGVIVDQRVVVAVEAIEGTDRMMERVIPYKLKNGVLVKVVKPGQDMRVDLPSIGPRTVELMVKANISALIVEADGAMIVDPIRTKKLAEDNGIAIEGWRSNPTPLCDVR